jgi:SAM-dependent methyltransferase
MGVGIYLLSKGARTYSACDVNDLMRRTPEAFYDGFFQKLREIDGRAEIGLLRKELDNLRRAHPSRLKYSVRKKLDLAASLGAGTIDLVFSQAAFEHFDDVEAVAAQLGAVCRPGAMLVSEIDLKTHSRWIRDRDPNNIYRYGDGVYGLFRFSGIPNRLRPFRYKEIFERHGWTGVSITPLSELVGGDPYSGMDRAFADRRNEMGCLSISLCAKKMG